MVLSEEARRLVGILIIVIPTIEYGGYFLLTLLRRSRGEQVNDLQRSYYRAGHAHAGVLVILAIIAQFVIDAATLPSWLASLTRNGFAFAPILMSAGFFLGAPAPESVKPRRLILLVYLGALVLAVSAIIVGAALLFGG